MTASQQAFNNHLSVETLHHLRPGDIDALGHLNHARAVELFELGRFDWVKRRSIDIDPSCVPVVTRVDIRYQREIFLSEVVIRTCLKGLMHFSVEFLQTLHLRQNDASCAVVGNIWLSFIERTTRHPIRVRRLDFLAGLIDTTALS
ncbi:MAG TPA: thioesterase family protein [Steroidobacteraceae bacterium]